MKTDLETSHKAVLLHCCCGPCTLYPLETLREEGYEVIGCFDNPNIHPYREFQLRMDSFRTAAERFHLFAVIEKEYGLAAFMSSLQGCEEAVYQATSEARCAVCYRTRLENVAAFCRKAGLAVFSTTLLVSPYQRHDMIREIGEKVADKYGLTFLYRDFRTGFRQGQAAAQETGLYMQGYCGCVFSEYARYGKENAD